VRVAKKVSTALSHEHEVAGEPGSHLRLLVGGVVVEDHVHHLAGRDFCFDGVEEADELLMAMALHAAAEHRAVEHVEGGEQGGGSMALVDPMRARRTGVLLSRFRPTTSA